MHYLILLLDDGLSALGLVGTLSKMTPDLGHQLQLSTTDNQSAIKKLIDLDPHVTIKELANTLNIATGTVDGILKSQLNLSKVCTRWVPHSLTTAQKVQRVKCCQKLLKMYTGRDDSRLFEIITGDETWVRYDTPLSKESNKVWMESQSDPPMIAKRDFRSAKIMYCIFFNGRGPVAQILVPKGKTVTGNFYTNNCLLDVENHLTRRIPKTEAKGIRLLHDNARPHKTKHVQKKIASMGMVKLEHPPYSPDLARTTIIYSQSLRNTCLVDILIATQLSVRRYFSI